MKIIFIVFLWKFVYASDMNYIPDSWVDPNDMRHYDRYSKTMKVPTSVEYENGNSVAERADDNENMLDLVNDMKRFKIFLERFINRFLQTAGLKDKIMKPETRFNIEIPIQITSEELDRLVTISNHITSVHLNELDELFSAILSRERGFSFDSLTPYLNPVEQLFCNLSWEKITIIIYVLVSGIVLWMFAVGRELKRILFFVYLIIFMAGLAWNWWNMYQEAVVEQYVQMQKSAQIPDVCVPQKVSVLSYFFFYSKVDQECEKYHKAMRIDPFSKVPPTIVLSETISAMFIHPLKMFGSGLGELLTGINQAASWPLNIIFLPFVFLTLTGFLLCVVVVSLGIKLNFWTLLGGVTIGGRTYNESPSYQKISDEMSLKRTIDSEDDHSYVLIQVGTVRKCLHEATRETKSISILEEGNGDNILRHRNVYTSIAEKRPDDFNCNSSDNASRDPSNNLMELFKYIPKNKIQSFRIQKSVLHKRKHL